MRTTLGWEGRKCCFFRVTRPELRHLFTVHPKQWKSKLILLSTSHLSWKHTSYFCVNYSRLSEQGKEIISICLCDQQDAAYILIFIVNNVQHVSGVFRPSSGAYELYEQPMLVVCYGWYIHNYVGKYKLLVLVGL